MKIICVVLKQFKVDIFTGCLCFLLCASHLVESLGPLCLNCQNVPFPRDCNRIVQCADGERCEAKNFITGSANTLYDVGCSSNCRTKRYVSQSDDITVCDECCDGDYCNRDLCPYGTQPDLSNRTYCLRCDDVIDPTQCENTVLCKPNEICYTEYIKRNGEYRYRMGCISPQSCRASSPSDSINKRFLINADVRIDSYCNQCCRDRTGISGNCNRKLCNSQEPSPANVEVLTLVDPPIRTDSCVDLAETGCKILVLEDPTECNVPGIAHYACRRTCGTCVATVNPGTPLPATDCFYESRKYQGAYETTVTGTDCVDWSSVFHVDSMASMFPDASLKDARNRCRDPDGRGHPWCFTSTNNGWEYCPVPFCEQCFFANQSRLYSGYKDTDQNGTKCETWTSSGVPLPDASFVDGSRAAAGSYCRNPFQTGSTGGSIEVPVCYTNAGFKRCGVQQCPTPCHDSPSTNCTLVKAYVCQNEFTSLTLCPKTCGKCNFGLLPGKKIPPPKGFCEDNPAANCIALQGFICSDPQGARTLCPRTCKRCNEITNPPQTPKTTTQAPIQTTAASSPSTTQIAVAQWSAWGSYSCQITNGVCLMTRFRKCPGTGCQGQGSQVTLCTKQYCPDEIRQLNEKTTPTTTQTTPTTTSTTQTTRKTTPTTTEQPTTTTDSSCRDSGRFQDCTLVIDAVCTDPDFMYECNKTCKLCDCVDVFKCGAAGPNNYFCQDAENAQKYCRKTCNKCDLPSIPVTYNSCGDPVSNDILCDFLQKEICLCNDDEIKQLCPNYCAGTCGAVSPCNAKTKRSIEEISLILSTALRQKNGFQ